MAGAKYLGPATTVEYDSHHYVQGDVIPAPEKVLKRMAAMGHRFEGVEAPVEPIEPTPKPVMYHDDRGQGHVVERRSRPEPAARKD